jgi:hypothetical protein
VTGREVSGRSRLGRLAQPEKTCLQLLETRSQGQRDAVGSAALLFGLYKAGLTDKAALKLVLHGTTGSRIGLLCGCYPPTLGL